MHPTRVLLALSSVFAAATAYVGQGPNIIKHDGKPVGKQSFIDGGAWSSLPNCRGY
jgi:hypothetical protein